MKRNGMVFVLTGLISVTLVSADGETPRPKTAWPEVQIDERLAEVLAKVDAAGPYEVPQLEIKKDDNYAKTSVDVEPFGAVKPYKEHFLESMNRRKISK